VVLATFVLWKLNHIHPFINGNGRTARAASYYVLCLKNGGLLRGSPILPELLKQNRPEYIETLKKAGASLMTGALDLAPIHGLVVRPLEMQLASCFGQSG